MGGFGGGGKKSFVSEIQIEKYYMYMGFILFAGPVFL